MPPFFFVPSSFIPDDLQKIVFCLAAGMVMGCFHFGGLWFTLYRFTKTRFSGLVFIVSFLFRSFVTLTGIFILGNGEWVGMTVCLGGILVMRQIFIVKMQPPGICRVKGSHI